MQVAVKGSVTVFLSMVILLLIVFIGGIIESATLQSGKSEKRASVDLATESVFGEFQKELLEEYDLFGIDSGYGQREGGEEMVARRLEYYGPSNTSYSIQRIQYLSDQEGKIFVRQAVKSMLGGTDLGEKSSNAAKEQMWKQEQTKAEEYEDKQKETDRQLEQVLSQTEGEMPEENNPISHMKKLGQGNFAKLICTDQEKLSNRSVDLSGMPSHRALQKGRGTFSLEEKNVAEKVLFDEYVIKHFENAAESRSGEKEHALAYEIEYLLGGEESDDANLEKTGKKLLLIRMASNYAYLLTDTEKQAEAETTAGILSAVILSPELEPLIKQGLLIAWAYGEGITDLRSLLAGGKIPLAKNRESWQTDLLGILRLGTGSDDGTVKGQGEGMTYKEYLRMLLFLEKTEVLSMRALDLIEANIKLQSSSTGFRLDQCVTAMETEAVSSLQRGITYRFRTSYRYR